jgi:hypothetical protein
MVGKAANASRISLWPSATWAGKRARALPVAGLRCVLMLPLIVVYYSKRERLAKELLPKRL